MANKDNKMEKRLEGSLMMKGKFEELERGFFKFIGGRYKGNLCRRNTRTYMNPNSPHLSSTPDGLLLKGVDKIVGVVELKVMSFGSLDELWAAISNGKRLGISIRRDDCDDIWIEAREGHSWFSQLYCHMAVLRVEMALLGVYLVDKWFTAEVWRDPEKMSTVVQNTWRTYFRVLKKLEIPDLLQKAEQPKNVGRPPKKKWLRRKENLPRDFRTTNLTTNPEDLDEEETVGTNKQAPENHAILSPPL